jgi:Arc/MetJ-type ribon-helix-helix transcriptional regulator
MSPANRSVARIPIDEDAMSLGLSPHNEQFIEQVVARGDFHDRGQALDQAVELLRRRQELLDHIDEGARQLRGGEGIELHGDEELRAFFNRIQAEGMQRYQRCKNAR